MRISPVIVIGMHRSGTSVLVSALRSLGLYTGYDLEPNAEARYFLQLNEEMLRLAGARWDAPDAMQSLLEDTELVDWLARRMEGRMHGIQTALFLSKPGWLRYRDIRDYPKPWGWKDPRNTLTLPVWLKLFPDAKVVHVIRHPVDVASSLQVREKKLRQATLQGDPARDEWRLTSPQCIDLSYGFELWEKYMQFGHDAVSQLPLNQYYTLTFEEWLEQPLDDLIRLNEWLGLGADDNTLADIAHGLKVERRFAFSRDEELLQFARTQCPKSKYMLKYYPEMVSI